MVADGEAGELVFTSLTKEGMPVIRYRTRDLTHLKPGTATAMRCIAKITGRADDMLIIRGVNVFPSQIEELILHCAGLAPHYEIEISRPHRLDEVRAGGSPPLAGGRRASGRRGAACAQAQIDGRHIGEHQGGGQRLPAPLDREGVPRQRPPMKPLA